MTVLDVKNSIRTVSLMVLSLGASISIADAVKPVLEAELSDTATLPAAGPQRFLMINYTHSIVIYDGEAGKIEGQIPAAPDSMVAIGPNNGHYYVAETMWTHGNRGDRLDLLSIYDGKTLNLVKEVTLPGRALVGLKLNNLSLSSSAKRAYVYNLHPASSVSWVDLGKQTVGGTVEVPGCALVFPWGDTGFSSLCGDGSMATVSAPDGATPQITHSKPFFDPNHDPIFDNSLLDHATDTALLLSYTGLIYQAKLGATPVVEKPWSIQEAAGQKAPGTGNDELAWRPGGVQPIVWHKASDRIFVQMHPGNQWSHNKGGTEIWVLNYKTHALLARYPVILKTDGSMRSFAVSQGKKPNLFIITEDGGTHVLDADTGEELRKIDFAKGDAAVVPGF